MGRRCRAEVGRLGLERRTCRWLTGITFCGVSRRVVRQEKSVAFKFEVDCQLRPRLKIQISTRESVGEGIKVDGRMCLRLEKGTAGVDLEVNGRLRPCQKFADTREMVRCVPPKLMPKDGTPRPAGNS